MSLHACSFCICWHLLWLNPLLSQYPLWVSPNLSCPAIRQSVFINNDSTTLSQCTKGFFHSKEVTSLVTALILYGLMLLLFTLNTSYLQMKRDLFISCSSCLLSIPSNVMYSPSQTLSLNKLFNMLFLAMIVYHRSKWSNTNPSVCHPLFLYSKFCLDPLPLKIKTIFLKADKHRHTFPRTIILLRAYFQKEAWIASDSVSIEPGQLPGSDVTAGILRQETQEASSVWKEL